MYIYFLISLVFLIIITCLQHKRYIIKNDTKNENTYKAIKYVNNIQLVFIICTTLISFIVYLGMKHEEYYEKQTVKIINLIKNLGIIIIF